ncbi:MAG: hypothetical protein DRQ62_03310 [Gammaproteobacteria bacterium]|nr:MAG: hypothetical protein DRQ62_03310 [Gammaproteobacteria bacterium]
MKPYLRLVLFPLCLLLASCSLHSADKKVASVVAHAPIQLDNEIHQLLQQEMQAIQTGMMSLVPAIASGDWGKVAEIGKQIEGSYLLKQKLTTEQRHTLHHSLPAGFIKLDQAFHHSAGMLAHAAEMGHSDIVNFYFYKLNTACVECHTEFASARFPMLENKQTEAHHH